MTSSIFWRDVIFDVFLWKHFYWSDLPKIGRIVDFDIKKSEIKFQTGSAIFAEDMTDVMIDKGHILLGDSTMGDLLPHFLFVFFLHSPYFFCSIE